MNNNSNEKKFLINNLRIPLILRDKIKDFIFLDKETSDNLNYMRKHVLSFIGICQYICNDDEDPQTYFKSLLESYYFFKNHSTKKHFYI
tara:strand:- start:767 stop:1033 length:267 start_codon:yes stop_codon:yes gene_type:complete